MYVSNRPMSARTGVLIALALSISCSSDKSVGIRHSPPAVSITKPADDTDFYVHEDVWFTAEVTTRDGSEITEVEHQWVANDTILCAWGPVPGDGIAECSAAFDDPGNTAVSVTVKDARSDTSEAQIKINILSDEDLMPPSITITAPGDNSFFAPGDPITFEATVYDEDDPEEDLVVTATSSLDGGLSVSAIPTTDGSWTANIADLSGGEHLITLTVFDSHEATGSDSRTITINGSPSAPVVQITPNPSPSGELLTAIIVEESVDPEGDPIDYQYQWLVNDETYPDGDTPVIPAFVTQRDEYWEVVVTARDPFTNSAPASDDIIIGNSPPRIDGVTIIPVTPRTLDDLMASPSGWVDQDGDPPLYTFEWEHNGEVDTDEILDTFPMEKTERGDEIRVTVTPRDGFADGESVNSSVTTIENTPPSGGGAIITPGVPEPVEDLLCTVDVIPTDDDGDPITYVYAWFVDGVEEPGLVSPAVPSSATANLETWTCEVTPSDGLEEGTMFSDTVTISDGTAPPPPDINSPSGHRNKDAMDLTGFCEEEAELHFYCTDTGGSSWTVIGTCTSAGEFSVSVDPLVRGETTECYATATDSAGNVSGPSVTISTEVCDPEDIYENSTYGDSMVDPIDEWGSLDDDGTTTINIIGNVLEDDDEDWYIITAGDSLAEDLAAGTDEFKFDANIAVGDSQYSMVVYRDDPMGADADSCMPDPDGYTEYSWYNQDAGDADDHAIPTDLQACGDSSPTLNDCEDNTSDFFVHVFRNSSVAASCNNYQIQVTNGVW
jgi:hypothetical protein